MSTATSDNYAVAHGATVHAGRFSSADAIAGRTAGLAIVRALNGAGKIMVFRDWYWGPGRYERFQEVTILDASTGTNVFALECRCLESDNGTQVDLTGSLYSLVEHNSTTVLATAVPFNTSDFTFSLNVSSLAAGWHVFDILGGVAGEIAVPYPMYIKKAAIEADPELMPSWTSMFEVGEFIWDYKLVWLPAVFSPRGPALTARTFLDITTYVAQSELYREVLVPTALTGGVHRPNRTASGVMNTANQQSYAFFNLTKRIPLTPLLDGPRGQGSASFTTHLQPASAAPGGVRRRVTYFCDAWRFGKIGEDGSVVTLAGYRHKNIHRYWEDAPTDAVVASPSNPDGTLELVGDWSAVGVKGFHEIWGMAWDPRTLAIDPTAPLIGGETPHLIGPVTFITDTQNNRIIKLQFQPAVRTDPVVTEFITSTPAGPLLDPWDIVFDPADNTLIISERQRNRIIKCSADTGAYVSTVVTGTAGIGVMDGRVAILAPGVDQETAQTVDLALPEGLFLHAGYLYYGSRVQKQVHRINLTTHVIEVRATWTEALQNFVKIAVSDGTFGPEHTLFVSKWDTIAAGYPIIFKTDGSLWNILPGNQGRVQRGRTNGHTDTLGNYSAVVGVGFGRLLCASSGEGIVEFSSVHPDDPPEPDVPALRRAVIDERFIAAEWGPWEKLGHYLMYPMYGFSQTGHPDPWGSTVDVDAYLTHMGALPQTLPAWVPTTVGVAALVPMTNTLGSVVSSLSIPREPNGNSFQQYSGGVYNAYIGQYGAHVIHGGGHATSEDNSIFLANYNTLQFERRWGPTDLSAIGKYVNYAGYTDFYDYGGGPITSGTLFGTSYGYFISKGPTSTNWLAPQPPSSGGYATADNPVLNPAEVVPGVPGSSHTYDTMSIVPPWVCNDAEGALLRINSLATGVVVSRGSTFAHAFKFSAGAWTVTPNGFGVSTDSADAGISSSYDTLRNKVWPISVNNRQHIGELDAATMTWTNHFYVYPPGMPGDNSYVDNTFAAYHVIRDIHAWCTSAQDATAQVFAWMPGATTNGSERNLVTWTNGVGPAAGHTADGGQGAGALIYVPPLGKYVWYAQTALNTYYEIDVPATPGNPWTWTAKTITGVTPSSLSPAPYSSIYKRFDFVPKLKSILWVTGQIGNNGFGGRVLCIRVVP